jgi:hypothetical protein
LTTPLVTGDLVTVPLLVADLSGTGWRRAARFCCAKMIADNERAMKRNRRPGNKELFLTQSS